jgi:LysM repeat protein
MIMKNNAVIRLIYKAVMISGLAICGLEAASAQEYVNTPVSISKEKVKTADGKICYSHIVLEKQTLFSIAKAYNVTVDELYAINPTLKEMGLKKNSIILIPVKEDVKAEAPAVQKNPQPVQPQALPLAKNRKQKTHVAKWYEDLDAIAEKYGVSTAALMKANNLTEKKLANRQKLVIPDPEEYPETTEESTDTEGPENPIDAEGDMLTENSDSTVLDEEHPVSMTLILPLKAGEETMSRNNMDFYSGVLIAVRDLADKGISTTMNVYDSTDPSHPVTIDDLNSSNLIIGPVSSADLKRMTDSMPTSCDIISPLDQRA